MLISYIVGTGTTGAAAFENTIPSIFQIQDLIENAWDQGIHEDGRTELGVLRGTRKYIGTPEVSSTAIFLLPVRLQGQLMENYSFAVD